MANMRPVEGDSSMMTAAQTYAHEHVSKTVASQSSARRSSASDHRFHSGSVSSVHSMTSPLTKSESAGASRRSMDSARPHARSLSTPPSQSDWKASTRMQAAAAHVYKSG